MSPSACKYTEEIESALPGSPTVLLKLKDDDELIWQQKVMLNKEVCVGSLAS